MKKIYFFLIAALFATSATAQKDTIFVLIKESGKQPPIVFSPRLKEAYLGEVKETPIKVLGIFKSKEKASLWLGVGGAIAMAYGSFEHGKAAHIIQTQNYNAAKYERTRFRGFLGHGLGIAAETTSFVYRQEKWYRKWAIPLGVLEAGLWFWVNKEVAEFTYRQM